MKFRKKPVVVEAVQLPAECFGNCIRASADAMCRFEDAIVDWLGHMPEWQWRGGKAPGLVIPTLEGDHLASPGDWIIRGLAGEFYPCKPDIFAASYEAAE